MILDYKYILKNSNEELVLYLIKIKFIRIFSIYLLSKFVFASFVGKGTFEVIVGFR